MDDYLGEEPVNIKQDEKFKNFTKSDWAMLYIESYGHIDGSHHKMWLLDQVSQILKGTEVELSIARWSDGKSEYRFNTSKNKSKEYLDWRKYMLGELVDGEYQYDYDEGSAP